MGKIYVSEFNLPSTYQRVEYIETDGNAYILTDYKLTNYTHIVAEFSNVTGGSVDCPLFGAADGNYSAWFQWAGSGYNYFSTTQGNTWKGFATSVDPGGSNFLVDKMPNVCIIYYGNNGSSSAAVELNDTSGFSVINSYCTIFTVNAQDGIWPGIQSGARLHSFKIYDKDSQSATEELRRNYIPCYRKFDNQPGLYDLVNGVFYANASSVSNSQFLCGSNIFLNVARQAKKVYIGVNGVAKEIKGGYAGVESIAKSIFNSEVPVSIPDMTSNSAPAGTASASNSYSSRYPWHAFDQNTSTFWTQSTQSSTNQWVAYDFGYLVRPTKTTVRTNGNNAAKTVKCQGYNTSTSSWVDLATLSMANSTAIKSADISTSIKYSKFRWLVTAYYSSGFARITEITLDGFK